MLLQLLKAKEKEIDIPDFVPDMISSMEKLELPKHHILHTEGQQCHHLYLVEKGLCRVFYYKDGKDISCHFSKEGDIVTAIDSFFKNTPSQYRIELLEDCTLYSLSFKKVDSLLDTYPTFERVFRGILMQSYDELVQRLDDLQFRSAKERYDLFFQKNKSLFQRVSLGQIASFLGITQETLSRMRKTP